MEKANAVQCHVGLLHNEMKCIDEVWPCVDSGRQAKWMANQRPKNRSQREIQVNKRNICIVMTLRFKKDNVVRVIALTLPLNLGSGFGRS